MDINNLIDINSINNQNDIKNLNKKVNNLNENESKKLKKLSSDFESIFLKQLLDISMKNSTFAGTGAGKDIIMGMYTDALSQSGSGSFGFSDMMYDYLIKQSQKQHNNTKDKLSLQETNN